MSTKTSAHRLADLVLERPLSGWVAERRERGDSWRRIAIDLERDTDGQVTVTDETLRSWFPDLSADPEGVASP